MKKFKLLIICALISNAYAQEKEKEPDLKTLYGADSTRVTPRNLTNTISQSNPFNPATYQNTGYSIPLKTAYSCQSYRGQYDIDSQAIGTFYIITENNPYLPNYKQVIMTDNSNCYQPCSPTNKNIYKSCDTIYGSGYTGMITYNVYSSCTSGGYLQAQEPTYVSDNCVAPPPPPTPTPVVPTPVTPTPTPVVPTPVTPTPTPVDPTPVIPTPTPVEPTPVIPTPTPVEPAPVVPTPTPIGCETIEGYVPLDTVLGPCDIWSRGVSYPRGQTYICKSYGWVQKNLGDRVIKVWCS